MMIAPKYEYILDTISNQNISGKNIQYKQDGKELFEHVLLQLPMFEKLCEREQLRYLVAVMEYLRTLSNDCVLQNPRLKNMVLNFAKNLIYQTIAVEFVGDNIISSVVMISNGYQYKNSSSGYNKRAHLLVLQIFVILIEYSFVSWPSLMNQFRIVIKNHKSKLIKSKLLNLITILINKNYIDICGLDNFIDVSLNLINSTRNVIIFSHAMDFLGQLYVSIHSSTSKNVLSNLSRSTTIIKDTTIDLGQMNFKGFPTMMVVAIADEIDQLRSKYAFLNDGSIFIGLLAIYLKNNNSMILCSVMMIIINILTIELLKVDFIMYTTFCELLEHESENVRLLAIDLISLLAHYMGTKKINSMENYTADNSNIKGIYLADDIFMNMCGVIRCDSVTKIQYKALVSLRNVLPITSECMVECISKELVSNHNTKKSFHQQQKERYGIIFDEYVSDVSTNKIVDKPTKKLEILKLDPTSSPNKDIPLNNDNKSIVVSYSGKNDDHLNEKSKVNDPIESNVIKERSQTNTLFDNPSLKRRSHCGTFIDVLEVEFQEIRTAAIDTLYSLASRQNKCNMNNEFVNNACDLLISSINDSIPNVRFEAIRKLISLMSITKESFNDDNCNEKIPKYNSVHHQNFNENNALQSTTTLELSDYQLYAALEALTDVSIDIRKQVYCLLQNTQLSSSLSLYTVIVALINNLVTYPHDKWFIWNCCRQFGLKHGYFVPAMIHSLFRIHPYYVNPQPILSDNFYITQAILLFNAAYSYPPLMSLLPKYSAKHYSFLRNIYCDLVPDIVFNGGDISYNYLESLSFLNITENPYELQQQILDNFKQFFNCQQQNIRTCLESSVVMNQNLSIDEHSQEFIVADLTHYTDLINQARNAISKNKPPMNLLSQISLKINFHIILFELIAEFCTFVACVTCNLIQKYNPNMLESILIKSISLYGRILNMCYRNNLSCYELQPHKLTLHMMLFYLDITIFWNVLLLISTIKIDAPTYLNIATHQYHYKDTDNRSLNNPYSLFQNVMKNCDNLFVNNVSKLMEYSTELETTIKYLISICDNWLNDIYSIEPSYDTNIDNHYSVDSNCDITSKIRYFLDWSTWIHLITYIPHSFVDNLEYCGAYLLSPYQSNKKSIHKFHSIGHLLVPFHSIIFNRKQLLNEDFYILVKFPNNSYVQYNPGGVDELNFRGNNLHIISELRLDCFPWSESGTVMIGPVQKIPTGIFQILPQSFINILFDIQYNFNEVFLLRNGLVELCEPNCIKILPYL